MLDELRPTSILESFETKIYTNDDEVGAFELNVYATSISKKKRFGKWPKSI